MASSVSLQIAETLQTAHINSNPSPAHDINPSTAASRKEPVVLDSKGPADYYDDDSIDEDDDEISVGVLHPKPRPRHQHLPLPDLRFEQSYLRSIAKADTWWKVSWITARDQVRLLCQPFRHVSVIPEESNTG